MITDIAILGSGASGTHSLLRILDELDSTTGKMSITVVDRDHQFHSGIPYGHRSGPSSLLITQLADFLPARELSDFTKWLDEHRDKIVASSKIDSDWIAKHGDAIESGHWADLYLPRRIYGRYLRYRVDNAIQDAEARGTAHVRYVNADISEVIPQNDGTHVLRGRNTLCHSTTVEGQSGEAAEQFSSSGSQTVEDYDAVSVVGVPPVEIRALTVVLAVGSPPVRRLQVSVRAEGESTSVISSDTSGNEATDQFAGYVADVHSPAIGTVIERIRDRLHQIPPDRRRILVVGGNADALEFILASVGLRSETGAELTVLSTQGRPLHWRHEHEGECAEAPALGDYLDAIEQGAAPTARALLAAVEEDVARSILTGNDKATIATIIEVVSRVVGRMDDTELAEMADTFGLQISNQIRRAGGDAIDLIDSLTAEDAVAFEPGRFKSAVGDRSMFTVEVQRPHYSDADSPTKGGLRTETLPRTYSIIVNATGFETIPETRSRLLRQMQKTGIASASRSHAGLTTDSRFRTAEGIYVVGPLLSGFHHGGTAVWHAESVTRIIELAARIAPHIVTDTLSRRKR